MAKVLIAWKCRICKTVTYIEVADPESKGRNMPGYCAGCGIDADYKDMQYIGRFITIKEAGKIDQAR